MDIVVARMAGHGTPAHQIRLPPMNVSETFDSLLGDLVVDPVLGLVSPSWRARGDLEVPLGITDVPLEQRREYYSVDLSGAGGHVAVIGGPLSGKSTALRSLVMGLALTRTPVEVQVYVIDLGAGRSGPCSTCRTWPASPPVASPTSSPGSWPRCRRCWTIAARALAHGANDACRAIAEAWTGPQGPKLRLLPTRIDLATLQEQVPPGGAPVIGINEARLEPVRLDMSHDPHFIVLGMPRPVGGASRAMFEPITQTLNDLSTLGIMLPGSPDEGPLLGRQKPIPEPPGRARLISRDHGVQSLQLAWAPPTR